MDAATEILDELNREPTPSSSTPKPEAHVIDARKSYVGAEQLKMMGFNIAEKGG